MAKKISKTSAIFVGLLGALLLVVGTTSFFSQHMAGKNGHVIEGVHAQVGGIIFSLSGAYMIFCAFRRK